VLATDPSTQLTQARGQPKAIVRDNGGNRSRSNGRWKNEFGVKASGVGASSDVAGCFPSAILLVYGPLLHGTRCVEGTPIVHAGRRHLLGVIAEHGDGGAFTAPTAFRAIKGRPKGEVVPNTISRKFRTVPRVEQPDPKPSKG